MSEQVTGSVQSTSRDGSLSFGAVLLHNAHISAGRTALGCGPCGGSLEGVLAPPPPEPPPIPEPEVVEGDRTDDERAASPPFGGGADDWR